ncbi:hypothetical protein ACG904_09580 [Acinetobacter guillouiae]|uniref:hypothetical protein n=1 Tax=Acinetobacter guillouiae TaxID=106649 RepID=UPI003AF51898
MLNVITKEDELLQTLQALFGGQFKKRYENLDAQAMIMIVRGALMNLSDVQFRQGMARLYSSRFCPDIAEFRAWCVSGSWQTAQEAWQRACDYSNQSEVDSIKSTLKITKLAKLAWDSVYWMVVQGDMKSAYQQFKTLYEDYVAKAQTLGKQQEWYVPPVMIGSKEPVKSIPKTYKSNLTGEQKSIADLTSKIMATGKSWKDAFQEAQMEVRGVVKPMMQGELV